MFIHPPRFLVTLEFKKIVLFYKNLNFFQELVILFFFDSKICFCSKEVVGLGQPRGGTKPKKSECNRNSMPIKVI